MSGDSKRTLRPNDLPAGVLAAARQYVAQRWPDMAAVEPSITRREQPPLSYVLTFSAPARAGDGRQLARSVRLTIDPQGSVLRAVASK